MKTGCRNGYSSYELVYTQKEKKLYLRGAFIFGYYYLNVM